jgi:hypothetical protein
LGAVLSDARVAVFPVDWRTLTTSPAYDVTSDVSVEEKAKAVGPIRVVPRPDVWVPQLDLVYRQDDTFRIHTMDTIAEQTGGKAFYNTNGLGDAISAGTRLGNTACTLTYSPSNKEFRGEYRSIRVDLANHPGYRLSYRRGYVAAVTPAEKHTARPSLDRLKYAAQFGSPTSRDLPFSVSINLAGKSGAPSGEQMRELLEFQTARASEFPNTVGDLPGRVQKCVLRYTIPLSVPNSGGARNQVQLELAVVAYDGDGNAVNGVRSSVRKKLTSTVGMHELHLEQQIAVPEEASSLRIVVL